MMNKAEYKKCDLMFLVSVMVFIFSAGYAFSLKRQAEEQFEKDKKELQYELMYSYAKKDLIPMPICEVDKEGNLTYFNIAFIDLVFVPMGVEADFMYGKPAGVLFGAEKDSVYRAHNNIVMNEKKILQFTESGKDTNGILHTLEMTKYPLIIKDSVVGVGVIANYKF